MSTWGCHTTAVGVHTKVLISSQKWQDLFAHSEPPWSTNHPGLPLFLSCPPPSRSLGLDSEKALPFRGKERHSLGKDGCVEKHQAEQGAQKPWIWSNTGQDCYVTLGKPLAVSEPLCHEQVSPVSKSHVSPCTPSHPEACWDLLSTPPPHATHSLPP